MTDERIAEIARACADEIWRLYMDENDSPDSADAIAEKWIRRAVSKALDEQDGYLIKEVDRLRTENEKLRGLLREVPLDRVCLSGSHFDKQARAALKEGE